MHHESKTESFRFVCSLLLIFFFLLAAVAYFFVYRHLVIESDSSAALTEQTISVKNTLPLREDVARFLDVYFNQKNLTGEDKYRFVLAEYLRFAQYPGAGQADQLLLARFVSIVGDMVAKYEAGDSDFSVEDRALVALYQEVK